MDADPHKPLRDDVRLLGELLGETLQRTPANGCSARSSVCGPWPRAPGPAMTRISACSPTSLARMSLDDALPVARAFAHFLHLANIAEQHHRSPPPPRLSARSRRAAAARLVRRGLRAADRRRHQSPIGCTKPSARCSIELVLTAHPTEVARRTLVQKYNRIAAALAPRDRPI